MYCSCLVVLPEASVPYKRPSHLNLLSSMAVTRWLKGLGLLTKKSSTFSRGVVLKLTLAHGCGFKKKQLECSKINWISVYDLSGKSSAFISTPSRRKGQSAERRPAPTVNVTTALLTNLDFMVSVKFVHIKYQ